MTLLDVKGRDGVRVMPLFKDAREDVRLEQWAPGAAIEFDPDGGLEVLVLEGGFREGGETLRAAVMVAAAHRHALQRARDHRRLPRLDQRGPPPSRPSSAPHG